jgi:DNA-binding NarL/FixJ family response regulator
LVSDCGEIDDHQAAADDLVHRLTPRQIEVLRLLATGLSTHAIAERLFISELTVRNHVENLLHKLEVHSRLEAVSLAHHSGLV